MYGSTLSVGRRRVARLPSLPRAEAINSVPYDGRPACNNCGFCAYFACPIHAKGDPVAMLQRALSSGNAELRPETFVSRIRTDGRRATGVDFIGPDGVERSMDARYVVVAGGAVETPRLLLLSGFDHPLIGRHLMTHFQTIVVGGFARSASTVNGPGGDRDARRRLIPDDESRAAAKEAGLPWMKGGMVEHGGPALPVMEAKIYRWGGPQKGHAGLTDAGATLGVHHAGRGPAGADQQIDLDPDCPGRAGFPRGPLHLPAPPARAGRLRPPRAAAGCHPRCDGCGVDLGGHLAGRQGRPGDRTTEHAPMSRHVMGTVRMGTDPETSVADAMGRLHQFENVVIADSSVFLTSSGYGPTLTLAALAARAATAMVG